MVGLHLAVGSLGIGQHLQCLAADIVLLLIGQAVVGVAGFVYLALAEQGVLHLAYLLDQLDGYQLVLHADFSRGALHGERPLVAVVLYGRQLYLVQHSYGTARCCYGSTPLSLDLVDEPASIGGDGDGHHVTLGGGGHGVAVHGEGNRSVYLGPVGLFQTVFGGIYSARGHNCHDQCEQTK